MDLHAWYGESHVLHGMDVPRDEGEVVTLLGRNGAGRTSTLRAIHGPDRRAGLDQGERGTETMGQRRHHRIARLGIGYCPEERGIFSSLSAGEPAAAARSRPGGMAVEQIYAMFPNLKERKSSQGTACPAASSRCWPWRASCAPAPAAAARRDLRRPGAGDRPEARRDGAAARQGFTIVMVEQNFRFAAPLADPSTSWSTARSSRLHQSELPARMERLHHTSASERPKRQFFHPTENRP